MAKSRISIGALVAYSVPASQMTKTVRGGAEQIGSNFHPEMVTFAGQVGRVHQGKGGETADLVIFPPGRDHKWVMGAAEGDGPGHFVTVTG